MVHLILYYGFNRLEVEYDPEDDADTLFYQLFSLTNVAPEAQVLFGVIPAGPVTLASVTGTVLTVNDGQEIGMLEPVENLTDGVDDGKSDDLGVFVEEFASAWQTTCTRSFFGDESVHQPCMAVTDTSNPGKPPAFVCFACATTCYLPTQVTPAKSSGLLAERGFTCGCHIAKMSSGGCLLLPQPVLGSNSSSGVTSSSRSMTNVVTGPARTAMINSMSVAFKDQQLRQSLQDKSSMVQLTQQQSLNAMLARITSGAKSVLLYQDPTTQAEALRAIPVAVLCKRAFESTNRKANSRLEVLYQLLRWFRNEFFKWTNAPECSACHGATRSIGGTAPTPEERLGMASVVEVYQCTNVTCNAMTRFPRYNHPRTLLHWRKGRCGEWANCFTLCCIAMGYDARHCSDWTDHVWTEVWSTHDKRWLHLDPAETAYDSPLLYEAGWGKKLTYIIASNKDEVVDVTRRYTKKYDEVLSRRVAVPEAWLAVAIALLDHTQKHQVSKASAARLKELAWRHAFEMRELQRNIRLDAGVRKPEELQGRISGSLNWRLLRGEMGGSGGGGDGSVPITTSTSSQQSSTFPGLLLSWDVLGTATDVSAVVSHMTSFGEQLIGVHSPDGALVWCHSKAFMSQFTTPSTTTTTASLWKRLAVWDESGAVWPSTDAPLVTIAAVAGSMKLFALDSRGKLFVMIAGPKPTEPGSLRGTATSTSDKKVSRAVHVGYAPAGTSKLVVLDQSLLCIAPSSLTTTVTADGTSSQAVTVLYRWDWSVDEACNAACVALNATDATSGTVSVAVTGGIGKTWTPIIQSNHVDRLVCVGSLLLSCGEGTIRALFNSDDVTSTTTPSSPSIAYPPEAGVAFVHARVLSLRQQFSVRVHRAGGVRTTGEKLNTAQDWLGLGKIGQPNECIAKCVVDLASVGVDASASVIDIDWPSDRSPDEPGVYEFRYYTGYGYDNLRAVGPPIIILTDNRGPFHWLPIATVQNIAEVAFTAEKFIAIAQSKEVCSGTVPRGLLTLKSNIHPPQSITSSSSPVITATPLTSSVVPTSLTITSVTDTTVSTSPVKSPTSVEIDIKRMFQQLVRGCGDIGCDNPHCATGSGRAMKPTEAAATAVKIVTQSPTPIRFCVPASTK